VKLNVGKRAVGAASVVLVLVYVLREPREVRAISLAAPRDRKGRSMPAGKKPTVLKPTGTDWERMKREAAAGVPIPAAHRRPCSGPGRREVRCAESRRRGGGLRVVA
jgi:hypothetical protein